MGQEQDWSVGGSQHESLVAPWTGYIGGGYTVKGGDLVPAVDVELVEAGLLHVGWVVAFNLDVTGDCQAGGDVRIPAFVSPLSDLPPDDSIGRGVELAWILPSIGYGQFRGGNCQRNFRHCSKGWKAQGEEE